MLKISDFSPAQLSVNVEYLSASLLFFTGLGGLLALAHLLAKRVSRSTYLAVAIALSVLLPILLLIGQSFVMTIPGIGPCSVFDSIVPCSTYPVQFAALVIGPFMLLGIPVSLYLFYDGWCQARRSG